MTMMCFSRVNMITLNRVLIRTFNATDDRNVPVEMMNGTVMVSFALSENPDGSSWFCFSSIAGWHIDSRHRSGGISPSLPSLYFICRSVSEFCHPSSLIFVFFV